jgi:plasmid stabilization system protein ParE
MRVRFSPRSRRDLERIRAYIAAESDSQPTADRFLGRLINSCEALEIFPERYGAYPGAKNWRMMPFGNYLVFFQLDRAEVRIGHIRHAARKPFGR